MPFPVRLSYLNTMTPIHSLPVELLTRIFQLGVDSQPPPEDLDPAELTLEVILSHVCRHWRNVALHTPHLWTTLHFRIQSHMGRGKTYLARNARLPFDIYVDTCSEDSYAHRPHLLFRAHFLPVFDIFIRHIDRWRALHLKVADLECKAYARKVLSTCGPAPALRTLQLWHVQNWQTPERLFTAIGPPPVVVFAGQLPSLKHIILQGVNLPWVNSPFLRNLLSIEYALHSDDVRMPFPLWRTMLAASPTLERLSLHYSGPRARSSGATGPPDGIEWWGADPPDSAAASDPGGHPHAHTIPPPASDPVLLPCLHEVQLTDLDADYLIAVFKSVDAPNLRALYLELETEDQEYSPFLDFLVSGAPAPAHPHTNGDLHSNGVAAAQGKQRTPPTPSPKFPRLEKLSVTRLTCSAESWKAFLQNARSLTRLELDVPALHAGAFGDLFGTVCAEGKEGRQCACDCEQGPEAEVGAADAGGGEGEGREAPRPGPSTHAHPPPPPPPGSGKAPASRSHPPSPAHPHPHPHHKRRIPILPSLREVRLAGVPPRELARLAAYRRTCGAQFRIRRWEVEETLRDAEGIAFEQEVDAASARWEAAERARARGWERERAHDSAGSQEGEGGVRALAEPWRWDEPVERVVWYRDDEGEYVDEGDEDEGQDDEEEDDDDDECEEEGDEDEDEA